MLGRDCPDDPGLRPDLIPACGRNTAGDRAPAGCIAVAMGGTPGPAGVPQRGGWGPPRRGPTLPGLQVALFSRSLTVSRETASTISSSTRRLASSRIDHRARPWGASQRARAMAIARCWPFILGGAPDRGRSTRAASNPPQAKRRRVLCTVEGWISRAFGDLSVGRSRVGAEQDGAAMALFARRRLVAELLQELALMPRQADDETLGTAHDHHRGGTAWGGESIDD
jgi:hypothetical protein